MITLTNRYQRGDRIMVDPEKHAAHLELPALRGLPARYVQPWSADGYYSLIEVEHTGQTRKLRQYSAWRDLRFIVTTESLSRIY